jgi:hypothetical protein
MAEPPWSMSVTSPHWPGGMPLIASKYLAALISEVELP